MRTSTTRGKRLRTSRFRSPVVHKEHFVKKKAFRKGLSLVAISGQGDVVIQLAGTNSKLDSKSA